MYDYEYEPQVVSAFCHSMSVTCQLTVKKCADAPSPSPCRKFFHQSPRVRVCILIPLLFSDDISSLLLKTDAVIAMSPAALEPEEAVVAFRQWLGSLGKKVYFAGPLVPEGANADSGEKAGSPVALQIQTFLDRQLQEKGQHSVLYVSLRDCGGSLNYGTNAKLQISFGSMFFPLNPEVFAAFLETVMEQKIPFVSTIHSNHNSLSFSPVLSSLCRLLAIPRPSPSSPTS